MTPQKTESRGHSFLGAGEGMTLAIYLNSAIRLSRVDGEDTIKLIEIAHRARTATPTMELKLAEEATSVVTRYRFTPDVAEIKNSVWKIEWTYTGIGSPGPMGIRLALELAKLGLLHRMSRCEKSDCQLWYFKKFAHQRFHDDDCRLAVSAADPERKANRATSMRMLRATKKRRAEAKGKRKGGR